MSAPGLLIAAPRSGSGKTTLTLGLMRAFRQAGIRVAGAKCGPDYIDPAFHAAAAGRPSLNLDSWAMEPDLLQTLAETTGRDADLLLCEGSMGLFDGVPAGAGRMGASADIAAATGWPVLLVIDAGGQAQSAAAIVKGCMTYDGRIEIAGVVLNKIASPRHEKLAAGAIEALGVKVVGCLPRSEGIVLPERHLGLVQASETGDLDARLDAMAAFVNKNVDLDAVRALARHRRGQDNVPVCAIAPPAQTIAVARDAAFSFFYPHLLQGWRAAGAEIRFFSPLADEPPPKDCDLCWLPGGYPELHPGQLAGASRFLDGLRAFAIQKPVHGECGGYMILGQTLTDAGGVQHRMAGLLGVSTSFFTRKLHLGYREARLLADGPLGPAGSRLKGHEFHYATVADPGSDAPFAMVADAYGAAPAPAGGRRGLVTGSFFHAIASETTFMGFQRPPAFGGSRAEPLPCAKQGKVRAPP